MPRKSNVAALKNKIGRLNDRIMHLEDQLDHHVAQIKIQLKQINDRFRRQDSIDDVESMLRWYHKLTRWDTWLFRHPRKEQIHLCVKNLTPLHEDIIQIIQKYALLSTDE